MIRRVFTSAGAVASASTIVGISSFLFPSAADEPHDEKAGRGQAAKAKADASRSAGQSARPGAADKKASGSGSAAPAARAAAGAAHGSSSAARSHAPSSQQQSNHAQVKAKGDAQSKSEAGKPSAGHAARAGGSASAKASADKRSDRSTAARMNSSSGGTRSALAHKGNSPGSSPDSASNSKNHQRQDEGATTDVRANRKALPRPPVPPPNIVALSAAEQLGKNIFFDSTLSNPPGLSCATCHLPAAGFTGPSSAINAATGPMPGAVPGRVGRRKPQSVPYATFSPPGPYFSQELGVFLGGTFWDGRTPDTAGQARMPFLDANEMANIPVGPYPPHAGGFSPLVATKISQAPYAPLFEQVFGLDVFSSSEANVYSMATQAIAAFEASAEVNPFSSKYDASEHGWPPSNRYRFNRSESNGMALFFGKAQCSQCHSSATLGPVLAVTGGKNTFTMYCYANIGVPKNPNNPFYHNTNSVTNPNGFNALGVHFIDYGLGMNPNPAPDGTKFMTATVGDIPTYRGLFKAPSVRNVDMRPTRDFVKAYMHNGVFKSLEPVVHFYNTRNIAVNGNGEARAFDLRDGPPTGFVRLHAPPEVLDNVQNVAGVSPADATSDVSSNGQVGNLGLSHAEEIDLVNFLRTLTDGYTGPNPVENDDD